MHNGVSSKHLKYALFAFAHLAIIGIGLRTFEVLLATPIAAMALYIFAFLRRDTTGIFARTLVWKGLLTTIALVLPWFLPSLVLSWVLFDSVIMFGMVAAPVLALFTPSLCAALGMWPFVSPAH